jgi:hypothetical protein
MMWVLCAVHSRMFLQIPHWSVHRLYSDAFTNLTLIQCAFSTPCFCPLCARNAIQCVPWWPLPESAAALTQGSINHSSSRGKRLQVALHLAT